MQIVVEGLLCIVLFCIYVCIGICAITVLKYAIIFCKESFEESFLLRIICISSYIGSNMLICFIYYLYIIC